MKKLLIVCLILILALSLAGCKQQTPAEKVWESMKDIEIKVDEKAVQESKEAIERVKQELGH